MRENEVTFFVIYKTEHGSPLFYLVKCFRVRPVISVSPYFTRVLKNNSKGYHFFKKILAFLKKKCYYFFNKFQKQIEREVTLIVERIYVFSRQEISYIKQGD